MTAAEATPLLRIEGLRVTFGTGARTTAPVDGVDLSVPRGGTLGIVGESGCGKSMLSLAVMGLLPAPGQIAAGRITLDGRDITRLSAPDMRRLRGHEIGMIFQDPMTSLNPVHSVGWQIVEALRMHDRTASARALQAAAVAALRRVRIASPERRFDDYPHQLSGGMRQRVMIAMALACRPRLLIADEPTTALDVTVQAQILDLLRTLQAETGMSLILITHDLGVIAEMADEVAVMYAGRVVERCQAASLFAEPQHPYAIGLLGSIPGLDAGQGRLLSIEGSVPPPFAMPAGCRFHPRCPFTLDACQAADPAMRELAPGHHASCLRAPLDMRAA